MIKVEVIGSHNTYEKFFESKEKALEYCSCNKYYFNNALVVIIDGDTSEFYDY